MPQLADHGSSKYIKLLLIGDAGTAKTSSQVSLVKAGYKLRIWDFDALLSPLIHRINQQCKDKIGNVSYMTFRDKLKASPVGPIVDGTPKAFNDAIKAFDKWEDGTVPATWGDNTVVVIDSLSRWSDSAMRWGEFITPAGKGGEKDGRAIYGEAQRAIAAGLSMLTSDAFQSNVIVIAHITYQERGGDGILKGFPRGPGSALGPDIPTYFPTILLAESSADGKSKVIRTAPTPLLDLKNPLGGQAPAVYQTDVALAEFFKQAKGN